MFQVPSSIESIATRVDNTIKITIGTQELPPEQAAELFRLKGSVGWFLFKDQPIIESEVPSEQALEFKSDKSPSQRLRAVLYKFWELKTARKQDFDSFYKQWTEKKINEIKELLG